MEFHFNMAHVSVIGHRRLDLANPEHLPVAPAHESLAEDAFVTNWQKPRQCQVRSLLYCVTKSCIKYNYEHVHVPGYVYDRVCTCMRRCSQERLRYRLHKLLEFFDPTPRSHKLQTSSSVSRSRDVTFLGISTL